VDGVSPQLDGVLPQLDRVLPQLDKAFSLLDIVFRQLNEALFYFYDIKKLTIIRSRVFLLN